MTLYEITSDIFKVHERYNLKDPYYAHCISADIAMGAGIAKQFDERFHIKDKLNAAWPDHPRIVSYPSCFRVDHIYNIITKERYWHKPTYDTLQAGLFSLRDLIIKDHVKVLVIPKIGCGLDQLKWDKVKPMIMKTFTGLDITIFICDKPQED